MTFDLDGHTLITAGDTDIGSGAANDVASLALTNTATARGQFKPLDVKLASAVTAKGTLAVTGGVDVTVTTNIAFGPSGQGVLNIAGGAHVQSGADPLNGDNTISGPNSNLAASITISGNGSSWTLDQLIIGGGLNSFAHVTISNNGVLQANKIHVFALQGGQATLLLFEKVM